jgi:hypothetical protein
MHLSDVAYAGGYFVVVGEAGTILTSRDGANWSSRTSGTKEWLGGLSYGKNAFIAFGHEGLTIRSGILSGDDVQVSKILSEKGKEIILWIGKSDMLVNGAYEEIDPGRGTVPVIIDDRTLMPIRAVIENLGGEVSWGESEEKVSIQLNGNVIELWIGKNSARINGAEKSMDISPQIINERTMLPLRFISENLGCQVNWDENTKKIIISYRKNDSY